MQEIIYTLDPAAELQRIVAEMKPSGVFLITDTNVGPLWSQATGFEASAVAIDAGDEAKNLDSAARVWSTLSKGGATRHSMVVNLGGGVVTDLGGFCAATLKRGIPFVNIPTTVLAAVDAAVGGKTGINFGGLKNEVGTFCEASHVIISPVWFATLPEAEVMSGYAEMLKHGLLSSPEDTTRLLASDPLSVSPEQWLELLRTSVVVKERIVAADPREKGLRKSLNLGHTLGHALEELALELGEPIPHGYAVAYGLVGALTLSHMLVGLNSSWLNAVGAFVREHYPAPVFTCDDYPRLIELMRHDKKNASADAINFTLLRAPGDVVLDCTPAETEITAAMDIMRDTLQ